MTSDYTVFWTDEAIRNLESILKYLAEHWSNREIGKFKKDYQNKLN